MKRFGMFSLPRAVALLVLLAALSVGHSAEATEVPDTLRFDPVLTYYPGQPGNGAMKAELKWSTATGGTAGELVFYLYWTGSIVCDSVLIAPGIQERCTVSVSVDNSTSSLVLDQLLTGAPFDHPKDYKYGDLYFSVEDTGVVDFTGSVVFYTVPGFWFTGHWEACSYYISSPGDVDDDGTAANIADVVYLIGYIFGSKPAEPTPFADINGDCMINITDAVALITYIFAEGSEPSSGCEFWVPRAWPFGR